MSHPRLFVGPMSKEIVDIVIDYAKERNTLGLIPSRRQIEYSGGYVNDWTTSEFSHYVKSRNSNICLVRDHGGPGQGSVPDDGLESFRNDVISQFDILHIDPWKTCKTVEEGIEKTERLIRSCCRLSENITFEVGTEESIFPYSERDLDLILGSLQEVLKDEFDRVKYAVIQSGVKISGTENVGNFDERRLEKMVKVVKKYGLFSKEHNGDYLTTNEIQNRSALGLDSINIAPEFGVAQTRILLKSGLVSLEEALETCKTINKFSKWIPENLRHDPPDELIVDVSGHYCFTKDPFRESVGLVKEELTRHLFSRFDEIHSAWE
jgi:hypothetical protein